MKMSKRNFQNKQNLEIHDDQTRQTNEAKRTLTSDSERRIPPLCERVEGKPYPKPINEKTNRRINEESNHKVEQERKEQKT